MNRLRNRNPFALAIVISLASTLAVSATAFTAIDRQSLPRALSSTNRHDKLQRTMEVEGHTAFAEQPAGGRAHDKAWLLQPGVFDSLSATGQRTALMLNGLLRNEGRVRGPIVQSGFTEQATPGDNIRVNDPSKDEFGVTNSETSIAVNGQNVIVTFNDASFSDVAGYGYSTNGGNTFTHKRLPTPDRGFGDSLGDGVAVFGPKGEIYYSTIADDRNFNIFIGVAKSTDNGATFSEVVDASTSANNENDFQDKEWLAVDRSPASPFKGNVYVTWTGFTQAGSFIRCSRSTDEGASFRRSVILSPEDGTQVVQGSMPAVAPNGDLYVAYTDRHFNSAGGITLVKSTDGGRTFSAPKPAATLLSVGSATGGNTVRTNSFPCIAIDKNGAVHITYDATVNANGSDRSDIFYTRSNDGGGTFSAPVKLNDDGTSTTQLFPSIAAAADGTLGVKWWDRRNDPLNDGLTDVYMTISRDGGLSFEKNFRVTNHNWVLGPSELGNYHGDYDGIAADGSNFFLSWSDERGLDPDAYFAQIPLNRDPNSPDFNISVRKPFDSVIAGHATDFEFSTSGPGVAGSLMLSASPAITGLQYTFANTPVNVGYVARLTVSTNAAVTPGTYVIHVAASGQGITRTTSFRVNVLDPARSVEAPRNITRTSGFTQLRQGLREDSTGTIHLVFDDDSTNVRGSDVYYSKSTDGGATYSAAIKVAPSALLSVDSSLALDGAGNPYVVWTGAKTGGPGFSVFLSRSTDHGNTFTPPVAISSASQSADLANIAVDKNVNVLVTYLDLTTSSPKLFAARSTNGGASFSAPVQISQPSESLSSIAGPILFDSTGAAFVVYSNLAASVPTINLAIASDGQRFAASKIISESSVAAFAANLAVDRSDNLYVTFYNRQFTAPFFSREVMLIKSNDHGGSFRPQIDASNNFGESTIPFVILGKSGEVNLVWQDTDENDQGDAYLARSTDGGIVFTEPVNLSANFGVSSLATGAADASGNLIAAWIDDSPANPDVLSVALSGLPAPAPDFALVFNPTQMNALRGSSVTINAFISRPGGFAGNVTVTAPDVSALKIKLKGGDTKSTTGEFVSFKLKLKGGGPTGAQQLMFSARDDIGRVRNGVLTLFIF